MWYNRAHGGVLVSDEEASFLRLTFNGGRFSGHTLPVDVLSELSTMQELIARVARALYREANPHKKRMPRGFVEAAKLHVGHTEDNCFSVEIQRPNTMRDATDYESAIFEQARDISMEAFEKAASGEPLPANLPAEAFDLLAAVGRRLRKDEHVIVAAPLQLRRPRVDYKSRSFLADLAKRPLEVEGELEGEIDGVDDGNSRLSLRLVDGEHVEGVPYDRADRDYVLDALGVRPLARVRVRCVFLVYQHPPYTFKVKQVNELEFSDHARAPEISLLWERIDSFNSIADGWCEGSGIAPTPIALERARDVLGRLLADYLDIGKPTVFPTPEGGVQVEWSFGKWQAEAVFDSIGALTAEATDIETQEAYESGELQVTWESAHALAHWLHTLGED